MSKKYTYDHPMAGNTVTMVVYTDNPNNVRAEPLVLIGKRSDKSDAHPGEWSLPGGFLNVGDECLRRAASREMLEETGISTDFDEWGLFHYTDRPGNDPRYTQVINLCFSQHVKKEWIGLAKADDDLSDLKWATFDQASEMVTAFTHNNILQKFIQNAWMSDATI